MNLEIIRKIPFREKKALVSEACLMFSKLLNTVKFVEREEQKLILNDSVIMSKKRNIKSISIFETIFSLLDQKLSTIIKNDFIDKISPFWYEEHMSKSNYYKLKHQAIDQFLFLLYA